jgi:glycosyltransferase involved in cell wall biosynthesis
MNFLVLNWRDCEHPRAGGAEYATLNIARELVERGHSVTWFAGSFPSASAEAQHDGVRIVRGGNAATVRMHARSFYRKNGRFDAVIDEINTLPFFAPLYADVPVIALIHQLAREVWFYEAPWPVAVAGYALEPAYLRVYRHTPVMTISQSSAQSIRAIGLRGPIEVFCCGIDQYDADPPLALYERNNTLVILGRITPSKRIDHAMRALAAIRAGSLATAELLVVGDGTPRVKETLIRLATQLGIAHRVRWEGRVSEERKRTLLRRAVALVMTSAREGWGLAIAEANLAGTPAVVYDIFGARDAVRHGITGLHSEAQPQAMAGALERLVRDPTEYHRIALAAQSDARGMTWRAAMDRIEPFLYGQIGH